MNRLDKFILAASALLFAAMIFSTRSTAIHTIIDDAGNLRTGTISNARQDASSVTLQGNAILISTVSAGLNTLLSTSSDLRSAVLFSTSELRSNLNNVLSTNIVNATILAVDLAGDVGSEVIFSSNVKTGTFATAVTIEKSTSELRSNLSNVLSTNIVNGTILAVDLAGDVGSEVVFSSNIKNGTITGDDIGNNVIRSTNVFDGTLTSDDIADNTIQGSDILDNTITNSEIADGAIQGKNLIGTSLIFSTHIANETIQSIDILDTTIAQSDLADSAVTGRHIAGNIILSSHTAVPLSSTTLFIQDEGVATGLVASSINCVGANISCTGSGGLATITITGGGGGGTTYLSTFTRVIGASGDVFIGSAIAGSQFTILQDTIVITSAQPFTLTASTVATTIFSVRRSTELGITNVAHSAIHSSSFPILINNRYGDIVVPDAITTIFPNESLSLYTVASPSSGTLPANYGVTIRYFKRP